MKILNFNRSLQNLKQNSRSGVSKTECETMKKSREDLQKVHSLLVEQHTQLVGTPKNELKNLNAQLAGVKNSVSDNNAALQKEVQSLKDAKAAFELSKKTLEEKLKNEEKRCADLEAQIK
ncbi:hypothetical protein NPIL_551991 [Nephila pilipes]|uniref:Uncharacterized protein n=1 Tax=Nephila pilipes TaxID=299642 RepID=A0A8X6TCR5_NEPPI|nr:hypothetical protein NPIL_551991 [Nephila pilipes]